jgi:hypothetical protein
MNCMRMPFQEIGSCRPLPVTAGRPRRMAPAPFTPARALRLPTSGLVCLLTATGALIGAPPGDAVIALVAAPVAGTAALEEVPRSVGEAAAGALDALDEADRTRAEEAPVHPAGAVRQEYAHP